MSEKEIGIPKYQIVFVRHGESTWNAENRFTGWYDCPLSAKGEQQAIEAGKRIKIWNDTQYGSSSLKPTTISHRFDLAFTSFQKRAIKTLWHVLEEIDYMYIPIQNAWQLNERHYGDLEGINKQVMREKYGSDQVYAWRRSFDTIPPLCPEDSPFHARNDEKYANIPSACDVSGESLKMTLERVLPYWEETIRPAILTNKRIIIAAHGNSLRALIKYLDGISDEDIPHLNIPMGIPLIYEFDEEMNVIPAADAIPPMQGKYLGDLEKIKKSIMKVQYQTK